MKKSAKIVGVVLLGVLVLYFVINLWDSKLNPDVYTLADLPKASLDNANGFFILWGLAEPAEVNVQSEGYTATIKKLLGPDAKNNRNKLYNYDDYKNKFKPYKDTLDKIKYPVSFEKDWISALSTETDKISRARQEAALPLRRYRQLIDCPKFAEFTGPSFRAPIPNLFAFHALARLYTASCTMDAVNGKWDEAVGNLMDQIDFTKRVIASSRTLIMGLIAKAAMRYSLQGLVSLLNHPQCPHPFILWYSPECRP